MSAASSRRELVLILAGNGAVLLLTLATGVISTRSLGPEGRGQFSGLLAIFTMLSVVLTLGVPQAVVTWRASLSPVRRLLLAQTAVAALAGLCVGTFRTLGGDPWLGMTGVAAGALIAGSSVAGSVNAGLAQRLGLMTRTFQHVRVLPVALLVGAMIGLGMTGNRDPAVWLLATGITGAVISVPQLYWLMRIDTRIGGSSEEDGEATAQNFARHALPRWLTALGSQVVYRVDMVVAATFLPFLLVGYYSIAVAAASACFALGSAVGMQFFSRAPGRDIRALNRGLLMTLALTGVVAVPIAVLSKPLVSFIYGSEFEPASLATAILALASIPMCMDYLLVHAAIKWDMSGEVVGVQVLSIVLTCALIALAVPTKSINLLAAVSLIVYTVSAGVLYARLKGRLRVEL